MSRRRPRPEERRAVYHEAGHAVARYRLRCPRGSRSIRIGGGGRSHRPPCSRPPLVLRLGDAVDRIQVCLAGSVAERRATGRVDRSAREIDRAQAAETALRVSFEPESDFLLRWLTLRTERLLALYWSEVDAVARALVERGSLSAREVEAAIRNAQTRRQPRLPRRSPRPRGA